MTSIVYINGSIACDSLYTPVIPKQPTPKAIKYIEDDFEIICATAGLHHLSATIHDYMEYNYGTLKSLVTETPDNFIDEVNITITNCLDWLRKIDADFDEKTPSNTLLEIMLIVNKMPRIFCFNKDQNRIASHPTNFPGIGTGITQDVIDHYNKNKAASASYIVKYAIERDSGSGGVIFTDEINSSANENCEPLVTVEAPIKNNWLAVNHF